jgi:endonuclease/exonuclease/phosphatase family metal-dependent hydrolase
MYACVLVSPDDILLAAFFCIGIPFLLLFHLLITMLGIWRGVKNVWGSLLSLAFGLPFIFGTLGVALPAVHEGPFHILSYNVNGFNDLSGKVDSDKQLGFRDWAVAHPAPIKVFQEFYAKIGSRPTNNYQQFIDAGYHGFLAPLKANNMGHTTGLTIFSKYPIIDQGIVLHESSGMNNIIFADIVVEQDTIRIYNAHLQSMGIDPSHVVEVEQLKQNYGKLGRQLGRGARKRAQQIEEGWRHMASSPYPIILAGDFNDTPYSYTYWAFRSKFKNAFESKGLGLGFTMNNLLFFLRIDNIFYEDRFKAKSFSTLNNVKYSDHFPVEASFVFDKK